LVDFKWFLEAAGMSTAEQIIESIALCVFEGREDPFPTDIREAYRQGMDHGELLFARRLRSVMRKEQRKGS
jgi:hypothetical protein